MIEDLTSCSWHHTHFGFIENILTIHSESLSASSLTISENRPIVTLHDILNHLTAHDTKDFLLTDAGLEDMIEGESQV